MKSSSSVRAETKDDSSGVVHGWNAEEFLRSHVVAIVLEVESDSFLDQSSDCHQLLLSFMDEYVLAYEQFVRDRSQMDEQLNSVASDCFGVEAAEKLFDCLWKRFPHLEKLERDRSLIDGNAFLCVDDVGTTEMVTLKEYLRAAVRHRLAREEWMSPQRLQ